MRKLLTSIVCLLCVGMLCAVPACGDSAKKDSSSSTASDSSTKDGTLDSSWQNPTAKYTITLECDKGEIDGQTTVVIKLEEGKTGADLPRPALQSQYYSGGAPDHRFVGWKYGTKILSATEELDFAETELTLTAVWGDYWIGPY